MFVYTISLSTDEAQIPYSPGDIFFSEEIHSTLFRHVILSLSWEHPQSKLYIFSGLHIEH